MTSPSHFPISSEFEPHGWIRGGHAQTVAGNCLPGVSYAVPGKLQLVDFPDGDLAALHEECPTSWTVGDPMALIVHGLGGTAQSPYMKRVAGKLAKRGVRVFRIDLRGCGATAGIARLPYHPGRSLDGLWAVEAIAQSCPHSPLTVIGFSMGANLLLKMVGEFRDQLPSNVKKCIAVNPPIDLGRSAEALDQPWTRIYNSRFVKTLVDQVEGSSKLLMRKDVIAARKQLRKIRDFDELFTSKVWGYESVDDFYDEGSAKYWLNEIAIPTLILAAKDDPIVPAGVFDDWPRSSAVQLSLLDNGGHMGFLARRNGDPDRRWLEWRIVDWITAGSSAGSLPKAA